MNNPVVSIIVVSYNEREYLDQAINGITAQTYPNIQLIIGDDGSSDGSIDYIKELAKDQKIEFFIKRALSISKGDYICLMSGDDFFCDNTKRRCISGGTPRSFRFRNRISETVS